MSKHSDTMSRLTRVAPQIRPAGVAGDHTKPTVGDLTSSYNPEGCVTPKSIEKFHHRGGEVGKAHRHWGLAGDPPADGSVCSGVKGLVASDMDECLRPGMHVNKMTSLVGEQLERNYASHRQKPLGRIPEPAYDVAVPRGGFGKPSSKGESTASTIAAMREVDVLHQPGAQLVRDYDWQAAGVDPTQHCFGAHSERCQSASTALTGGKETVLVPKVVNDYKSMVDYELGKPRSYGFDDPAEWDRSALRVSKGKASAANGFQLEQSTVKDLLSTWAVPLNAEDGEGGSGKGKSGRSGASTGAADHDATTSLRATVSTVARNGGTHTALATMEDEATVQQLVHPSHYVSLGVASKYFAGGRDLEDIRALAGRCDFGLPDARIDEVFSAIAIDGKCGIEQFKNAASAKGYM